MPTIKNIIFDTTNLQAASSSRSLTVIGDPGSVFTLYLSNEDNRDGTSQGKYYDFFTQSFTTSFSGLIDAKIPRSGKIKTKYSARIS